MNPHIEAALSENKAKQQSIRALFNKVLEIIEADGCKPMRPTSGEDRYELCGQVRFIRGCAETGRAR